MVLTTNHPEKLDPALARPGRINRQILRGNAQLSQAFAMMRHYCNGGRQLSMALEGRMPATFVDGVLSELSPAELEGVCAQHEDEEELVAWLEAYMLQWRRSHGQGAEAIEVTDKSRVLAAAAAAVAAADAAEGSAAAV